MSEHNIGNKDDFGYIDLNFSVMDERLDRKDPKPEKEKDAENNTASVEEKPVNTDHKSLLKNILSGAYKKNKE